MRMAESGGMKNIGRADVVLVNPMFNRVSGAAELNVPLGLEYMKQALREAGFAAEVLNLDYHGSGPGRPSAARGPGAGWVLTDSVLDGRKRRVEDRREQWWLEYEAALRLLSPKMVGIGMVTPQYHAAAMAARIAREIVPGVRVVAGGIHPTVMPEEVLLSGLFDAAAISEGERTIVRLARHFIRGEGVLEDIDGICYMRNGATVKTEPVELIEDLDSLNFPARDCIVPPLGRLTTAKYSATLITSRGCPFRCTFCARPALWMHRKVRYRSVANVVEELQFQKKNYETCYFYLLDDTFNVREDRVEQFCGALLERRLGMKWYCYLRAERLDAEQARLMRRAGLDTVFIGVETGSREILEKMNRCTTIEQTRRAVEILRNEGVFTTCTFILGHPDETPETISETTALFRALGADKSIVYFMVPYPGSELFDRLKSEERIATCDWFGYNMYNPSLIRGRRVSDEQLVAAARELYALEYVRFRKARFRTLRPSFILDKLKTVRSISRFKHLVRRLFRTIRGKY